VIRASENEYSTEQCARYAVLEHVSRGTEVTSRQTSWCCSVAAVRRASHKHLCLTVVQEATAAGNATAVKAFGAYGENTGLLTTSKQSGKVFVDFKAKVSP
jgi:hypothetical protein